MTERLLKGIGVSPGIAAGAAVVVRWALPEVPHRVVARTQVEKEIRRLRAAIKDVKRHLSELRARAVDRAGVDEARIFDAQILMLEDREFIGGAAELIRENHLTAEKAFEFKTLEVRDAWTDTGSPMLRERLADVTGVAILGPAMACAVGAALPLTAQYLAAPFEIWARGALAAVAALGFIALRWVPDRLTGLRLGLGLVAGALVVGWLWP